MKIPIGIDLGTTFSAVAHVADDGVIGILPNERGEQLTPSVVHFTSAGEAVVGAEAKLLAPADPDRVVAAIKRQMGQDFALSFDGVDYRPEGVSAIILRALVAAAARELGVGPDDLVAVVTVPAYFGTAEREATAAAARIARLEVLDLVAEPVAAALSYGVGSDDRGAVLVYDLGGGTFDATVIQLTADGPRVVAVDGVSQLGGLNFDHQLGQLLIERYVALTGDEDALDDEEFALRVYAEAEQVKQRLSRTESAVASIRRAGETAKVAVSREEFAQTTKGLLDQTITVVERAITAAAAHGCPRPGQVLLTGGSSRMPSVATALEAALGVPVRLSDPDIAVAKGAAIHARALLSRQEPASTPPLLATGVAARILASAPVRSVVPRALGVKLHDSNDPAGERVFVEHIIAANSPLPVEGATATFATVVDAQERVRIELMEQAGAVADPGLEFNRRILDGELTGLPDGLPAGSPIDVILSVGTDGRIACVARERSTKRELVIESYMDGVADGIEADAQQRAVSGLMVRG